MPQSDQRKPSFGEHPLVEFHVITNHIEAAQVAHLLRQHGGLLVRVFTREVRGGGTSVVVKMVVARKKPVA